MGQLAREWKASIMSKEGGWLGRLIKGWKAWERKVVSASSDDLRSAAEGLGFAGHAIGSIRISRSGLYQ